MTALQEEEFEGHMQQAIRYAKALDCERIHVMAGCMLEDGDLSMYSDCYVANMRKV